MTLNTSKESTNSESILSHALGCVHLITDLQYQVTSYDFDANKNAVLLTGERIPERPSFLHSI